MGVSLHSLVRRVPKALGPVVGGAFIAVWGVDDGVRLAFVAALALAAVAMVLQQALIEDDGGRHRVPRRRRIRLRLWTVTERRLAQSAGGRHPDSVLRADPGLVRGGVVQPERVAAGHRVSIWRGCRRSNRSRRCCVTFRWRISPTELGKKPFVVTTFVFFTLFPLTLLFCNRSMLLVPAFVLRGLKEFGEPTRKALIMDLAAGRPKGRRVRAVLPDARRDRVLRGIRRRVSLADQPVS